MDVTIVESGMEFTFPSDRLYHIERSPKFSSITGRKTCECIVMHNDKIVFIEAKKSSPRKEDPVRFDEFIRDLSMKFVDSFDFYCSVLVDRHKDETMPKALRSEPLSETEFEFYLIINGHRPEWLPPVMDGLKQELRKKLRIWNIKDSSVKVINEKIAQAKGLIKSTLSPQK